MRKVSSVLLGLAAAAAAASIAYAQTAPAPSAPSTQNEFHWPARMKNARVLPKTMSADELHNTMRSFAMSLGVRCSYCHVPGDFASDANPHKNVARGMIRMAMGINKELPKIADKDARVSCYTCHRGSPHPATAVPVAPPAPVMPKPPAS